jgi:hypothetical protein
MVFWNTYLSVGQKIEKMFVIGANISLLMTSRIAEPEEWQLFAGAEVFFGPAPEPGM